MSTKPISLRDLETVHKISFSHLAKWQAEGYDVHDSRQIVSRIWSLQRKPPEWIELFDRLTDKSSDDSHENLKKEKTRAELERLNIANSKARGESFDRKDGESVMASIASALTLRLTEFQSMTPPMIEGLEASDIEVVIGKELHKIRTDLADLESELWKRVYDQYIPDAAETPATPTLGVDSQSPAEAKRIKVVRAKRQTGSGASS